MSLQETSGLQPSTFTGPNIFELPCLGALLAICHKCHRKLKTIIGLKEILQPIRDSLPQKPVNKAVKELRKQPLQLRVDTLNNDIVNMDL